MTVNYKKFRKRLKDSKVRQKDLAKLLKVRPETISKKLTTGEPFSLEHINLIKFYLGMTTKDVIQELTDWELGEVRSYPTVRRFS